MRGLFFDSDGYPRFGWVFLASAIGVVLLIALIMLAVVQPLEEAGCNQQAEQFRVVDGDYRFLSNTCYLTLESGKVIPADRYRTIEKLEPASGERLRGEGRL